MSNIGRRIFFRRTGLELISAPLQAGTSSDSQSSLLTIHTTESIETYHLEDQPRTEIGTGSIELRRDGKLYIWLISNNCQLVSGSPFQLPNFPKTDDVASMLFFQLIKIETKRNSKIESTVGQSNFE